MFVLQRWTTSRVLRWTTSRILDQILNRTKTSHVRFSSQSYRWSLLSSVSVCDCNCTKYLPHSVSNQKLQILRQCANLVPSYWHGVRSEEKVEYAKKMYEKILTSLPERTLVVYTDGSVLDAEDRVGPCGVGVVIYRQSDNFKAELSVPVSPRASVDVAEYTAVETALSHIISNINLREVDKIQIFCDNQAVIKGCFYQIYDVEHQAVVRSIRKKWDDIVSEGISVAMDWVPSDSGVDGNDLADKLALQAAKKATSLPLESTLITERDVQRSMKQYTTITGSKGRRRDYSENVMLAILMKNSKGQKKTAEANNRSNLSEVETDVDFVDMNNRRVLFTGMTQDKLYQMMSKATLHGCSVDRKLSSATDFVVYGTCDTSQKDDVKKLAYKLGVQYVSSEDWERALSKCVKVGLPIFSEESYDNMKQQKKRHRNSDLQNKGNKIEKKGNKAIQKRKDR
ncbi:uncharacterized protein LOC132553218 [Ylistrum balloti]|uniref:uncharacterized protein LOC132553218 n=1 Tax=Ylistrum balloti TaxID=509963 RepID=UPI002905BCDD|nr:uncharacterized protein LOC132553218 [Ylistrum balloti]XP_060073442.1 uncharacterized protein LOC132553218 [Ylistrum balloti]